MRLKKRERELNKKWRIAGSAGKLGIDEKEKGNKTLCGKHCKL